MMLTRLPLFVFILVHLFSAASINGTKVEFIVAEAECLVSELVVPVQKSADKIIEGCKKVLGEHKNAGTFRLNVQQLIKWTQSGLENEFVDFVGIDKKKLASVREKMDQCGVMLRQAAAGFVLARKFLQLWWDTPETQDFPKKWVEESGADKLYMRFSTKSLDINGLSNRMNTLLSEAEANSKLLAGFLERSKKSKKYHPEQMATTLFGDLVVMADSLITVVVGARDIYTSLIIRYIYTVVNDVSQKPLTNSVMTHIDSLISQVQKSLSIEETGVKCASTVTKTLTASFAYNTHIRTVLAVSNSKVPKIIPKQSNDSLSTLFSLALIKWLVDKGHADLRVLYETVKAEREPDPELKKLQHFFNEWFFTRGLIYLPGLLRGNNNVTVQTIDDHLSNKYKDIWGKGRKYRFPVRPKEMRAVIEDFTDLLPTIDAFEAEYKPQPITDLAAAERKYGFRDQLEKAIESRKQLEVLFGNNAKKLEASERALLQKLIQDALEEFYSSLTEWWKPVKDTKNGQLLGLRWTAGDLCVGGPKTVVPPPPELKAITNGELGKEEEKAPQEITLKGIKVLVAPKNENPDKGEKGAEHLVPPNLLESPGSEKKEDPFKASSEEIMHLKVSPPAIEIPDLMHFSDSDDEKPHSPTATAGKTHKPQQKAEKNGPQLNRAESMNNSHGETVLSGQQQQQGALVPLQIVGNGDSNVHNPHNPQHFSHIYHPELHPVTLQQHHMIPHQFYNQHYQPHHPYSMNQQNLPHHLLHYNYQYINPQQFPQQEQQQSQSKGSKNPFDDDEEGGQVE